MKITIIITLIVSFFGQAVFAERVWAQENSEPISQPVVEQPVPVEEAPVEEASPAEESIPVEQPAEAVTEESVPTEEPEVAPEVVIVEQAPAEETQSNESSQTSDSPQNAATGQDSAPAGALEETFNPNDTAVDESSEATSSTPVVFPEEPAPESEAVPLEAEPLPADSPAGTTGTGESQNGAESTELPQEEIVPEVVAPLEDTPAPAVFLPDTEPTPRHTFAVKGGTIPTKRKGQAITEVPSLTTNVDAGALGINGSCNDPYYVVLLYKNQEDYDQNPGSYIFNKAFECRSGGYSYSLEDLPPSLADGTYHLLIGGQGETGSWSPISALIPITIQNNEQ